MWLREEIRMVRVALRAAVSDRYGAMPTYGTQVNIGTACCGP